MDRLNYVFDIASRYAPPDLYEEDGEICGDFPEVVTWFMGIVAGCHHYPDFINASPKSEVEPVIGVNEE